MMLPTPYARLPLAHRLRLGWVWWARSPLDAAKVLAVVAVVLVALYLTMTARFLGLVIGEAGTGSGRAGANVAALLVFAQGCAQILYVVLAPERRSHRFADPAWDALPVPHATLAAGRRLDALASASLWLALLVNLNFYLAAARAGVSAGLATACGLALGTTLVYQLFGIAGRRLLRWALASRLMQGVFAGLAIAAYLALATWAGRHMRDFGRVIDALGAFDPPPLLARLPLWWPAEAARDWVAGTTLPALQLVLVALVVAAGLYAAALRWVRDDAVLQVTRSSRLCRGRRPGSAMIANELLAASRSMRVALLMVTAIALGVGATVAYLRSPNPVTSLLVLLPVAIVTTGYTFNMLGAGGAALELLLAQPVPTRALLRSKLLVGLALYALAILAMACTALVVAPTLLDASFVGVVLCIALVSLAVGMPMSVRNPKPVSYDGIGAVTVNAIGNVVATTLLFTGSLAVRWYAETPHGPLRSILLVLALGLSAMFAVRMTTVSARTLVRQRESFLAQLR